LSSLLAGLDGAQLRSLLETVAQQWPDTLDFIERWVGTGVASPSSPNPEAAQRPAVAITVDLATIRRQVAALARRGVDGIDDYLAQVTGLLDNDQNQDALAVLEAVTEEVIGSIDEEEPHYSGGRYRGDYYDYDDDAGSEYYSLLESIGNLWAETLLSVDLSPDEREAYQELLIGWDEELAGSDWLGGEEFFRISLAALEYYWDYPPLEKVLAGTITDLGAWESAPPFQADQLAVIRLRVLERQGRLQEYLYLAEAEGQTTLYVNMLARVGRTEEAVSQALQFLDKVENAKQVAETLRNSGQIPAALQVAEHGLSLGGYGKHSLGVWLREEAARAGDLDLALRAGSIAVADQCQLGDYSRLQELAGEGWPDIQENLLAQLRQKGSSFGASAVDIFLHEGLIDDAIAALSPYDYGGKVIAVMNAAMQSRPDWVIQTAQKNAEAIMNAGKANHYDDATAWLRRAKEAYMGSGRKSGWTAYMAEVRQKHGRKWKLMGLLEGL
ncbi:MAG TPA: hypothetical protein PL105_21380, partial [Caldilineaceae bacterium]|nr:hypothetical protein [Caldilineaceae bacterium]